MEQNLQLLIEETQSSYYEYVTNIPSGCQRIADFITTGAVENALQEIAILSEGLAWLLEVEQHMEVQSYKINSHIRDAVNLYKGVNAALEEKNYVVVAMQFEQEMTSLFNESNSWRFEEVIS